MTRQRLGMLVTTLAACALVAAGCGGDDEADGDGTGSPDAAAQVEQCRQNVEDSGLEGDAREQALELCEAAGSGLEDLDEVNTEELQDEAEQIQQQAIDSCREIAKQIPDESARELALENCEEAAANGE